MFILKKEKNTAETQLLILVTFLGKQTSHSLNMSVQGIVKLKQMVLKPLVPVVSKYRLKQVNC